MLVYGDQQERLTVAAAAKRLAQLWARAEAASGLHRHALSVSLLIEAGRLQQGVEDAEEPCPALTAYLLNLAKAVLRSWDTHFNDQRLPRPPELPAIASELELRVPEGFAFYALYPEAYAVAARKLRLLAPPRVIGIRSIGTSLAAMVAAALDAPGFFTVRPNGDPFARTLSVDDEQATRLLDGPAHYVIVDEGPGQSGSSFGAVADWLEAQGIAPDHIAFLPSHAGPPGAQASARHRQRWNEAQRCPANLGDALPALLGGWLGLEQPLVEISGGAWRDHAASKTAPVQPMWERRKFLGQTPTGSVLIKFAGLGLIGERKLGMARALHADGFVPEPLALVHGFLVERWQTDAWALRPDERPVDEIATYLGARARLFPAEPDSGADADLLLTMAKRNIGLSMGADAAAKLAHWESRLPALDARVRRVRTDNKLDRHEWLRMPDGGLLKTDAVDHHAAHDLVGCQDIAWDVAGAFAEFDLSPAEQERLVRATASASGAPIDPERLAFDRLVYATFRLGQASMALDAMVPGSPDAGTLAASRDRYSTLIAQELDLLPTPTRQVRPVD